MGLNNREFYRRVDNINLEVGLHLIYENNNELYIAYTPNICLPNNYGLINNSIVQEDICNTFDKCKTFEDFPMAVMELVNGISYFANCNNNDLNGIQRKISFKSLANLLSVRSPVTNIDFGVNYREHWSTDYIYFKNISNKPLHIIENMTRIKRVILPDELVVFNKASKMITLPSISSSNVLKNKPL